MRLRTDSRWGWWLMVEVCGLCGLRGVISNLRGVRTHRVQNVQRENYRKIAVVTVLGEHEEDNPYTDKSPGHLFLRA